MAATKQVILTSEGLEKLEKELEYLKTVKRQEVAAEIKVALGYGDLSENSEYDEAKNKQAQMEIRIVEIETMLKNAKVIDEAEISTDTVSLGCTVTVYDVEFDEEIQYSIVGSTEADPSNGKISDESPVGSALLGKKVGDVVDAPVPAGTIELKIVAINK
ncbi:MAG: transcription elongation factor GreA [Clostridia bacterium]|nr:transcription elongation factor GreA [Clostridia bacterium]